MARQPEPDFSEVSIAPAAERAAAWRDRAAGRDLVAAGKAAHKVTILGTAAGEGITLTALTLARLMARDAKVVVVDLAASSLTMAAVSVEPTRPAWPN